MTTIANSFVAKLAVAFVAIAMMISVAAPTQAASDDLQAQIDALMATIAALQAQLGVEAGEAMTSSDVCPYTWTRSLNMGDTGSDVKKLQQFLNADAATQVAVSGAGSPGNETEYYGPATGAAVAKFQEMYRAEILSPLGLVNSTTFFGNSTRAQANKLCATAPVSDEEVDEEATDEEAEEASDSVTLGNDEGDITSVDEVSADESNLEEGTEGGVLAFTVEIEGDVEINRIDVFASEDGSDSEDAEDYFDGASLWMDGDKIAELDVSDFDQDDYNELGNSGDDYRLRFASLDLVFEDGDEPEFQVAFETVNNIDSGDITGDWDIGLESIRFVDGQGFTDTWEDTSNPLNDVFENFGFEAEEVAELDITKSSDSPDAATIEVDTDDTSAELTIFVFDIEEENGVDVTIEDIDMTASTTNIDVTTTIDEVILYVDGSEVGSDSPNAAGALAFENLGIEIDADGEVEVTAKVVFNGTDDYAEGDSVFLTFNAVSDASDANGNDENDMTGVNPTDFSSDTFSLRSEGIALSLDSVNETKDPAAYSGDIDTGTYVFGIDVDVFGDDFYMDEDVANVSYTLLVDGTAAPAASSTASLTISGSGADTAANADYKLAKGGDVTLTLTVETNAGVSGAVKVRVNSVAYSAADDTTEELTETASPAIDWTSDALILN